MDDYFVVVTGASTGIGRAVAIEFGKKGATVCLVARRITELEKTKTMVEEAGGKGIVFQCDLSDIASVNTLISKIAIKTKKINAFVHAAGVWHGDHEIYAGKDFESFDQKLILDTYAVGLVAPTLLVHGLVDLLKNGGKVVNISGTFENGAKGWVPYYISKRALEDLTIGMAEELKRLRIEVNCISPSDTATEAYAQYFPESITEALEPIKIAKHVVYLCNDAVDSATGKVWMMRKGEVPSESFHA